MAALLQLLAELGQSVNLADYTVWRDNLAGVIAILIGLRTRTDLGLVVRVGTPTWGLD